MMLIKSNNDSAIVQGNLVATSGSDAVANNALNTAVAAMYAAHPAAILYSVSMGFDSGVWQCAVVYWANKIGQAEFLTALSISNPQ